MSNVHPKESVAVVWDKRYQTMWDDLKTKSPQELITMMESFVEAMTADMEPYMVIELLKKNLGLAFIPPCSDKPKEDWMKDGWPEEELCEVKA